MIDARLVDNPRSGYALLIVLWLSIGIGGLVLVIAEAARDAIAPSGNRISLAQASWRAEGCLARVRDMVSQSLEQEAAPGEPKWGLWDEIDRTLRTSGASSRWDCRVEARPTGARLDVNRTDEPTLARLFRNMGMESSLADSAASRLVSRRPFVDLREVHLIPGLDSVMELDSVLDVDPSPIDVNHAPGVVLALLPGFSSEIVARVLEARARGAPIASFLELTTLVSEEDSTASARLPGIVVLRPTAWVITIRAAAGRPAISAALEVRLGRAGSSTTVGRRRSWTD